MQTTQRETKFAFYSTVFHIGYTFRQMKPVILFISGHVDPGENELQTAQRETEEEAGLSTRHYKILPEFEITLNYTVNNHPKRVVYWLGELCDNDTAIRLSDEHQDYKWLNLNAAKQLAGYEDLRKALDDSEQFIKTCKLEGL